MLEGTDGWIPCNNPANGNCFGIMHINDMSMTLFQIHYDSLLSQVKLPNICIKLKLRLLTMELVELNI